MYHGNKNDGAVRGCGVDEARSLATQDAAVVQSRRNGSGAVQEVGEIPRLTAALQESLLRLDREIGSLREKLSPVLSGNPHESGGAVTDKAASPIGNQLTNMIEHVNALSNCVVELQVRTSL